METYKLFVFCENKPGVLARVANVLRKRNINIDSLFVDTKKRVKIKNGIYSVVIEIEAKFKGRDKVDIIVKQLNKLINVLSVKSVKLKNCK